MVSELNVIGLNLDFVNSPSFKLNISRVEPHLLKESLSLQMKESVKIIVK